MQSFLLFGLMLSVFVFQITNSLQTKCSNVLSISPLHLHSNHYVTSHYIPTRTILCESARCREYAEFMDKNKRWGGPAGDIVRYVNTLLVASLFGFVLKGLNNFTAYRSDILFDHIWEREEGRGLLTVSNHKSFYDDPGIWSALLPFWRISPEQMRWTICTEDVFFSNPLITSILGAGNVVPLDRTGSIDQPVFQAFFNKLNQGQWCHIFAEGKVRQNWRFLDHEPKLGEFKIGVGKLIAHSKVCPIVIPIYHRGMDDVLPEVVLSNRKSSMPSKPISYIPRTHQNIAMYMGAPIDFSQTIRAFRLKHPGVLDDWRTTADSLEVYAEITCQIRKSVLLLEAEANGRDIGSSTGTNSNSISSCSSNKDTN